MVDLVPVEDDPFVAAAPPSGNVLDPASQYQSPWADSPLAKVGRAIGERGLAGAVPPRTIGAPADTMPAFWQRWPEMIAKLTGRSASGAPTPQSADNISLLDQAKAQYPVLRNLNIGYVENPKNGGNFLEYWPPGEKGGEGASRPQSLSLDKPGIEINRKDTRSIDVLGDIVSHQLIKSDPQIKGYYEQFTNSLTPAQEDILYKQYQRAQTSEGEKRSFPDWKESTGLPAYFRGYAFDQWPKEDAAKYYTPEQLKMFDGMMGYLRGENQQSSINQNGAYNLVPVDHDPFAGVP